MNGEVLRDCRAKITVRADQALAGLAHARGCDKQDIVREVLDAWAEKVIHESRVVTTFAPSEGKTGNGPE